MLYLDTSAAVKLLVEEKETGGLWAYLESTEGPLASSRVGLIELRRVARRVEADLDRAERLSASLLVVEVDREIERLAVDLDPRLRALDAIHLASALSLGEALGHFVCYDARLAEAAEPMGLHVVAPVAK